MLDPVGWQMGIKTKTEKTGHNLLRWVSEKETVYSIKKNCLRERESSPQNRACRKKTTGKDKLEQKDKEST